MFHLYLFHDKLGAAATRVFVHYNETINPDSYSPGYVKHVAVQASNYRTAKQVAKQYAPKVFDNRSKEVR